MPEAGFHAGYQILPYLRFSLGYSFFFWSDVVRPISQIDRLGTRTLVLNAGLPPSPDGHPTIPFNETSVFMQGLVLGLEYSW